MGSMRRFSPWVFLALAGCGSTGSAPADLYVDSVKLDVLSATATSSLASTARTVTIAMPVDTTPSTPGAEQTWIAELTLDESDFQTAPIGTEVFAHGTTTFAAGTPAYTYVPTPAGNPQASGAALFATTTATGARPTSGAQVADGSFFVTARSAEVVRLYVDTHVTGVLGPDGVAHAAILRATVDVPLSP